MEPIGFLTEIRKLGLVGCTRWLKSKNLEESRLYDALLGGMEKNVKVKAWRVVVVDTRMPKRPRILTNPQVLFDVIDLIANT